MKAFAERKDTDDLKEGQVNLYHSEDRVLSATAEIAAQAAASQEKLSDISSIPNLSLLYQLARNA